MPRAGHDGTLGRKGTAAAISIHVPRAGHDPHPLYLVTLFYISIHVPRAGHDGNAPASERCSNDFNPRAPCGARQMVNLIDRNAKIFQSTCPVRGTTESSKIFPKSGKFQSTCPVRGTTGYGLCQGSDHRISIHVPRAGHDEIVR